MSSLLGSTRNTRVLPIGTIKYIRSDVPEKLTDNETGWLLDNRITTAVDLRSEEETAERPCCLKDCEGFVYFNIPVTGGRCIPNSREQLHTVYRQMLDGQMKKIVDLIMNTKSNVMYFCTAGKDRTGVVSAVILKRLGFSNEVIIGDYMQSKENLADMLTAIADERSLDKEVIIPQRENMERLLKALSEDHSDLLQ